MGQRFLFHPHRASRRRIARAAGPDAPPEVKLGFGDYDAAKGAASPAFVLRAVRATASPIGPFPAMEDADYPWKVGAKLAPWPSRAVIDAIADAAALDVSVGTAKARIDLSGLAAAPRFMDAAQGRRGTSTALVNRGPSTQMPAAPAAPIVVAAPAGSVVPVANPIISKAMLDDMAKACDQPVAHLHELTKAWRLASLDRLLVLVPCMSAASNEEYRLYLTRADNSEPKAIVLPQPPMLNEFDYNMKFDPKTMDLTSFLKDISVGDCGSSVTWLWTGRDFALLEAASLPSCFGVMDDDWPPVYRAVRK